MASPSSRRATKRRRSSITELAFHGIHTSRLQSLQKAKSVTHVSGTKCHPCLGPVRPRRRRRELISAFNSASSRCERSSPVHIRSHSVRYIHSLEETMKLKFALVGLVTLA